MSGDGTGDLFDKGTVLLTLYRPPNLDGRELTVNPSISVLMTKIKKFFYWRSEVNKFGIWYFDYYFV